MEGSGTDECADEGPEKPLLLVKGAALEPEGEDAELDCSLLIVGKIGPQFPVTGCMARSRRMRGVVQQFQDGSIERERKSAVMEVSPVANKQALVPGQSILPALTDHPSLPSQSDSNESTRLHSAAESGHLEEVKQLVECGDASLLETKDARGFTPLEVARKVGQLAVVEYLSSKEEGMPSLELHLSDKPRGRKGENLQQRLQSFAQPPQAWPLESPTPLELAEVGFWYTGQEDRVVCWMCTAEVSGWREKGNPLVEHHAANPTCQFLVDNFSEEISVLSNHHKYASLTARRQSFAAWPLPLLYSELQMTNVGFFYTGRGTCVQCFSCGRSHSDWKEKDVPLLVHRRMSPDCPFLNTILKKKEERVSTSTASTSSSRITVALAMLDRLPTAGPSRPKVSRSDEIVEPPLKPSRPDYSDETHHPKKSSQPDYDETQHPKKLSRPDYSDEILRLKSFKHLPRNSPVQASDYALAGFFLLRPPTTVKCFSCNVVVSDWTRADVPLEKHRRASPYCPFLLKHFPAELDHTPRDHASSSAESFDQSSLPEPIVDEEELRTLSLAAPLREQSSVQRTSLHLPAIIPPPTPLSGPMPFQPHGSPFSTFSSFPSSSSSSSSRFLTPSSSSRFSTPPSSSSSSSHLTSEWSRSHYSSELPVQLPPSFQHKSAYLMPTHRPSFTHAQPSHLHTSTHSQQHAFTHSHLHASTHSQLAVEKPTPFVPQTDCVVCLDERRQMIIVPCGHYCVCEECSHQLSQCPICRNPIDRVQRVYEP